ncbi:MAG: hypothetical protein GC186_03805 [Rhodobacteraceae bacterium]|nr:hypothetical protein [Paracoccaceae bacterium]
MTPAGATILTAWTPDPVSVLVLAALAWAYIRGAVRQYARRGELADWRPMLFLGGLFLILIAMVSPLAALAREAAWLHQVQGAILRVIAPLAIFVSRPQRLIYTGMPKVLRRGVFARLWRDPALNRLGGLLATPLVAGALNIAIFIFWILPQTQDAAVAHALAGFAERASELAVGCLFFGVLFDARDPDLGGTRYGPRVIMLISTTLVMVVLGVALTVKPVLFYAVYPAGPRIAGFSPLDDEATGGFVNWAWVSMIYLMTFILVFVRWNAAEVRAYARAMNFTGSNSAALMLPETAEELWLIVTPRNKRLGLSLAIIPAVMMFLAIATVVTLHYRA